MMKNTIKAALIAGCFLFAGNVAKAQKMGYVNFSEVVTAMPDYKGIQTQLETYQKPLMENLQKMNAELNTQVQDYESKKATMAAAAKTQREKELTDLQKRLQDSNNDAQQKYQAKSQELAKPIIDKARAAVQQVAKEKGYAYVMDTSQLEFLVSPAGDDLLAPVKTKLGLK